MERVIFRTFDDSDEVIAFLPDAEANAGLMMSYMHIGQHGEADYIHCMTKTHLAYPNEYTSLKNELESLGYELDAKVRLTRNKAIGD